MKIGITATAAGLSEDQIKDFVRWLIAHLYVTELHHGDCVGGDSEVDNAARRVYPDLKIHIHPCTLEGKRAHCEQRGFSIVHSVKPPLVRNHDIVDASDILLAFPKSHEEELRSGTWATIRYARRVGRKIVYFYPL